MSTHSQLQPQPCTPTLDRGRSHTPAHRRTGERRQWTPSPTLSTRHARHTSRLEKKKRDVFSQFSCSVVSDSLRPHGLQHARPPCPSPSSGVCPSSCPLDRRCHPTISSSVALFSFCLQSFPSPACLLMSWLFASGGQSIGTSASVSVLPMNIQGWFPLRLTGFTPQCSRDSQESSPALQFKISILQHSAIFIVQLSHLYDYWKDHSLDYMNLYWQSDVFAS